MKAIVYEKYRTPDVLELKQGEKPVSKDNEVLIKVHAATAAGLNGRKGEPFFIRSFMGLTKPQKNILGQELSGENATHRPISSSLWLIRAKAARPMTLFLTQ